MTLDHQSTGFSPIKLVDMSDNQKDGEIENFELWSGMADVGNGLLATAKPQIPARLLKESTCEILMSTAPVVVLGEYRLRPRDEYYVKTAA